MMNQERNVPGASRQSQSKSRISQYGGRSNYQYGISQYSQSYLGSNKNRAREFVKAEQFGGMRSIAKRSNLPVATPAVITQTSKEKVKAKIRDSSQQSRSRMVRAAYAKSKSSLQQSSGNPTATKAATSKNSGGHSIPEFKVEKHAYLNESGLFKVAAPENLDDWEYGDFSIQASEPRPLTSAPPQASLPQSQKHSVKLLDLTTLTDPQSKILEDITSNMVQPGEMKVLSTARSRKDCHPKFSSERIINLPSEDQNMKDESCSGIRRTRKERQEETGVALDEAITNKPNPNTFIPKRSLYIGSPLSQKRASNLKENRTKVPSMVPSREIAAPVKPKQFGPTKTPSVLSTQPSSKLKGYYPSGTQTTLTKKKSIRLDLGAASKLSTQHPTKNIDAVMLEVDIKPRMSKPEKLTKGKLTCQYTKSIKAISPRKSPVRISAKQTPIRPRRESASGESCTIKSIQVRELKDSVSSQTVGNPEWKQVSMSGSRSFLKSTVSRATLKLPVITKSGQVTAAADQGEALVLFLAHLKNRSTKKPEPVVKSGSFKVDFGLYNSKPSALAMNSNSYSLRSNQNLGASRPLETANSFPSVLNYTNVSEYNLEGLLGQGNYAQVKLATHKATGFQVAIKIYDKYKLNANQQVKKSVSREIRLLSLLSNTARGEGGEISPDFGQGHPNVMKLYDAIDTPKQLYLILENVKGEMLHDILKKQDNRKLPERQSLLVFKQILAGLSFFHKRNIAHRDLKPENILVDMTNKDLPTKIIDFGFATQSTAQLCIFCGTPAFMSPELCAKERYWGPKTDVWAAGIVLYSMIMGQQPFRAKTESELYRKIIKGQFYLPTEEANLKHLGLIRSLISDMLVLKEDERKSSLKLLDTYSTSLFARATLEVAV